MSNFSSKTTVILAGCLCGLALLGLSGCGGTQVPPGQEVTEANWNKRLSPEQLKQAQSNNQPGKPPAAAQVGSPAKP